LSEKITRADPNPASQALASQALARRVLALIDLTDLSEQCSEAAITTLCAKARTAHGPVAAVCVWPQFVGLSRRLLKESGIAIATVVNFPQGGTNLLRVLDDMSECLDDGADEIDFVMPYSAFLAGDEAVAGEMIQALKDALEPRHRLKVILDTGACPDQDAVLRASRLAIAHGADFIKTSTGKTSVSATPEAVATMLNAIREAERPVGIKPSGGIRTVADASRYLSLADTMMSPDWASPSTFRFGASGLLDAVIDALEGRSDQGKNPSY
jgi:deoxyribose-phosphate aldolase